MEVTCETSPSVSNERSQKEDSFDLSDVIISSPYLERDHCLSLSSLPDRQSALLARALQSMKPVTQRYAVTPYEAVFNWEEIFSTLRDLCHQAGHTWKKQHFYVVAFNSRLHETIDQPLLDQLDKESHAEASASGGLLKYWFGSADTERRNLASCVWVSEMHAKLGGSGPWHKRARAEAPKFYENIQLRRMDLVIEDDIASWNIK